MQYPMHHVHSTAQGGARFSSRETRRLTQLAQQLDQHDPLARGHGERVAHNALRLGRALRLDASALETLFWGARLHDLGKLALPSGLLLKPSALSARERAAMRCHPVSGWQLLRHHVPGSAELAEVVRYHHERWDGRGYPDGLSGTGIPLFSRIVSVADVFEALTGRRPYRRALEPARAAAYLAREAGKHFEPELVAVFLKLYRRGELVVAQPEPSRPAKVNVGLEPTLDLKHSGEHVDL